jgi:DNA-binding LacI/PurR family transcriptional regulator
MKPTIKDVAKIAGVSPSTVSRVITKSEDLNIKEETRQRILNAIKKLNYKPNVIARSLRIKSTYTLGMVIPDITNSFFSILFKGADKVASEKDFSIILCNTDDNPNKAEKIINSLVQRQVDGLLLATTNFKNDILNNMNINKYPYVFVNRHLNNDIENYVITDNFLGAILAMEHLISLGHLRIAYVSGPLSIDTALNRLEGYKNSLKRHNLPFDSELVIESEMTEEGGYKAFYELIKRCWCKNP